MSVLVTGAGGYIGSIATYLLLQKGYTVVALDNFSTGYKQPLEVLQEKYGRQKLTIYEGNINDDLDTLFKQEDDIQVVLHYAASCLVNESMEFPAKYFVNNTAAANALLVQMMKYGIKKFIFSSTCAVYGDAQYVPLDEKHPTNPLNPYGESKRMLEKMVEWYANLGKMQYVILRYFNVCGASDDGLIGDSKRPSSLLVQNAVRGALNIEPFYLTCPTVDTPDETPIRDYINVVDLNEAHIKAIELILKNDESHIINLGTGTGNSVLEIVNEVQQVTGKKFDLSKGEQRKGEYAKMIASIEKAKKILGWAPKRTIKSSVESLTTWYSQHPNGWEY